MLADDLARQTADCQALLAEVTPPLDEGEKHRAYVADAARAYRECRGAKFPAEIRANALMKYALSVAPGGETQSAVAALTEAIEVLDRAPAGKAKLLINVLDQAAMIEAQTALQAAAIAHATRAADLRMATYDKTSPEAAIGLVQLGLVYADFNDYAKGEKLVRDGMRIAENVCRPACDALVQAYNGMEALYATRGNKAEAEKYAGLALEASTAQRRSAKQ